MLSNFKWTDVFSILKRTPTKIQKISVVQVPTTYCFLLQRKTKKKTTWFLGQQWGFPRRSIHPWVRWEGPGSGFENSSAGGAGGVWKSRIWNPWDLGRKTRFSNDMACNRSKVSFKKSQIGFVVINCSRSIFPYMWNKFMDGWKWRFGF